MVGQYILLMGESGWARRECGELGGKEPVLWGS